MLKALPFLFIFTSFTATANNLQPWESIPGCAKDISLSYDRTTIIGCDAQPGGYGIYQMMFASGYDKEWHKMDGAATNITDGRAAHIAGKIWVVNDAGSIFKRALFTGWISQPGCARDITFDASGLWVIGCDTQPGGYKIYRSNPISINDPADKPVEWNNIPGGGVHIAAGEKGLTWLVNDVGNIFNYNGSAWNYVPGCAKDIAVDSSGNTWIIGCTAQPGGYGIYRYQKVLRMGSTRWIKYSMGGVKIAVSTQVNAQSKTLTAWVVNDAGSIFRLSNIAE